MLPRYHSYTRVSKSVFTVFDVYEKPIRGTYFLRADLTLSTDVRYLRL